MPRITKDRVERRHELIDAAGRLFLEKGYEQTAVSDIVREIKVAQGTFYYHFDSKEAVLEAVVEKNLASLVEAVQSIAVNGKSPDLRLRQTFDAFFAFITSREDLMEYLHQDNNALMHNKITKKTIEGLVSPISVILAEGTKEGSFQVPYPEEAAEVILAALVHQLHRPDLGDSGRRERLGATLGLFMERTLGMEENSIRLEI